MRADVARLLGRYLVLAVGLVLLNFFLPRLLPGDPLSFTSGGGTDAAVPLSAAAREQLGAYYRLDEPRRHQLAAYLTDLAHGDLGRSIARPGPVTDLIRDRLPWTLGLLLTALLISGVAGTAAGVAAGWRPGRRADRFVVSVAGALAAIPEFLLAIGLLLVFAVELGWFPIYGGQTVFAGHEGGLSGTIRRALDTVRHLALPATALAVAGASGFLLLARDAMVGLRHEGWLVTARAKGMTERQVAFRHALPNLAPPLLAYLGLRLGGILSGALVVEQVFGVPGLGSLGFQAIRARDYPVLQALFLVSGLGVLTANLAVDLLQLGFLSRRGDARG